MVVTDQRSPRGGKFLENIGTFDPAKETKDVPLKLDTERLAYWRSNGAVPSETLERLLKRASKFEAAAAK